MLARNKQEIKTIKKRMREIEHEYADMHPTSLALLAGNMRRHYEVIAEEYENLCKRLDEANKE